MGRMYTVEFEGQSVTNANGTHDIFEITPADDKPCVIHGMILVVTSETGDAAEEILRLKVLRGGTAGSGGTVTTPAPLNPSDTAAGFTADTLNTTVGAGSPVDLHSDGMNVRVPYVLILPPEMRWHVTQGQTTLQVRLMAAVADDVTMSGTLYVEEQG